MPENKFLPFSTGERAVAMSDRYYEVDATRRDGIDFDAVERHPQEAGSINKALRQSTSMAAAVGEFIKNGGEDALDNGDIETLAKNLGDAVGAKTQPVLMTQAEYDALEDPPGSGEYPSLKGKSVVITDGDEAEFNYFAVPDYANIETVNRISANGGTWTADRSGYVKVYCSFANTNNNGGSDLWFVNNVGIAGSMRFQDTGQMEFTSVVKVAKGDVVMFSVNSNWTVALVKCFFIPPKFIKQAPPVVVDEPNGSYSLDEVKTAETWIDGKPIYKRTFTGTGPTSVGTFINDLLIPPGTIDTLTRSEPVYSAGGYDFVDKILVDNTTGAIVGTMRTMKHSNTGIQFGIWLASGVNALYAGGVYKVTVWYTKTTD